MSAHIRHFRGDPSSSAPPWHVILSLPACSAQPALLGEHRAVVATPEPPLACCCLREMPLHRGLQNPPCIHLQLPKCAGHSSGNAQGCSHGHRRDL